MSVNAYWRFLIFYTLSTNWLNCVHDGGKEAKDIQCDISCFRNTKYLTYIQ